MKTSYQLFALLCLCLGNYACVVEEDANRDGDNPSSADARTTETSTDAGSAPDFTLTEVDAQAPEGECVVDGDCGSFLRVCRDGQCLNRCFGGTCFQGGVCMDGACFPPECETDAQCGEDEICREESCIPRVSCESVDDCGENEACTDSVCEPLPRCVGDRNCAENEICERGYCRVRVTCTEDESICPEDEACIGGRCVPSGCRGVDDCEPNERCQGGNCVPAAIPDVERVIILTPGRGLSPGMTIELQAVGLNARGQIVVSDGFEWASANDRLDHLGEGSFFATLETGEAFVTASFETEDGAVVSEPVRFIILPSAPEGVASVRVVDPLGQPVAGAQVVTGAESAITNASGIVEFAIADGDIGELVTVFAEGFDYMSVVMSDCQEVLVPLSIRTDLTVSAGIEGVVNFDSIVSAGELETSLTGTAVTGGILGLSLERLIGSIFYGRLSFFGNGFDLPLPGGLTLAGQVPIIGQLDLKNRFYVKSDPGLRFVWSFAGRLDFQTIASFVRGGDGVDLGQVLAAVLPFFENFSHGLKTLPNVQSVPTIQDEDDLDGDDDTSEQRTDYLGNPEVTMRPTISQDLRVQVSLPDNLNDIGEVALLFMGAELPEVGFVPLGVTASDTPGSIPARLALPYGALSGAKVTAIAAATDFEGGDSILPTDLSVLVRRYERSVPGEIRFLRDFLQYDRDFSFNAQDNTLTASPSMNGSLSRWSLQGPTVRWIVQANGIHDVNIRLPAVPEGFPQLGGSPIVLQETIDLGDTPFGGLACPSPEGTLQDVDRLTIRFSRSSAN